MKTMARMSMRLAAGLVGAAAAGGEPRTFSFLSSELGYQLSTNAVREEFCDPSSKSLSGYFGVRGSEFDEEDDKNYFYWMFERRPSTAGEEIVEDADVPFVIWLNGGPGCSSMMGLLQENGPCLVNDDGESTRINPHSWTEVAHVLYLDQPADVGYSYGDDNDNDMEMIAEDAYYFLQSFFHSEEGEKYKDLPLFLTGESYAGHYIPAIAQRIQEGNDELDPNGDLLHLSLSGLAIGNGWLDMEEQVKWFAEQAYRNPHGIQIVDEDGYERMKEAGASCSDDVRACREGKIEVMRDFVCQKAMADEQTFFEPLEQKNISIYDITKPCIGPLCEDMTSIQTFLNLDDTKETLGVPSDIAWVPCSNHVGRLWSDADRVQNFAPVVSTLLDRGMQVLIYAGDKDYICNYLANRAVAMKLEWEHSEEFRSAEDHDWNDGGGLARSAGALSFLQVYGAGHMVPQDQPAQALAMISQFLNGQAF